MLQPTYEENQRNVSESDVIVNHSNIVDCRGGSNDTCAE